MGIAGAGQVAAAGLPFAQGEVTIAKVGECDGKLWP